MKYLQALSLTICLLIGYGQAMKLHHRGGNDNGLSKYWDSALESEGDKRPDDSQVDKDIKELSD